MTKEQESRIKLLKDFTKIDFSNPMGWTGYYDTELKELSQAIETVLSMLKEKDEEIKSLKEIKKMADSGITEFRKILDYDKLQSEIWILQIKLKEKDKEIEKKDQQIDLMAEHIAFNQKVNSYEDIKTYKEQIKQHYENQSKLFKYDYNKKSTLDINSNAKI